MGTGMTEEDKQIMVLTIQTAINDAMRETFETVVLLNQKVERLCTHSEEQAAAITSLRLWRSFLAGAVGMITILIPIVAAIIKR